MLAGIARHPLLAALAATGVAAAAVIAIGEVAGLHEVGRAFDHLHPGWLALGLLGRAISGPAYVVAYRAAVSATTGRRLVRRLTVEIVVAGFGPFAVAGGFEFDRRSLRRLGIDARLALRTVLELGGVEFLALVWIAFAAAVVAQLGDPGLPDSLIWPWLIAVPVGTGLAVAIARAEHPEDVPAARVLLHEVVAGLADVLGLARHPSRARGCWGGIAVYWLADMATLYVALRTFGLRPAPESLVLAYATGYLFSRRTLPLGGAGVVEVLLTFSLYWTHLPLAPALAGVVLYRAITFLLAAVPALVAWSRLQSPGELEHPFEAD